MKENGYTEAQMQAYWDELISINSVVGALHRSGVNWDQTNLTIIGNLPTEKERTLKRLEEHKNKLEAEEAERRKKEEERLYYEKHFEEIMVQKLSEKKSLSEREISTLVNEYGIESSYGENRRWTRSVSTVVKLLDKYYWINWEEGLTEYQSNEYFDQPYEVERHEYEKVIKVVEWVRKDE